MKQISKALLDAQKEMGAAIKDSKNPFFKSTYADLNSIREACMPALNKHGIAVLQPTVHIDGRNFVKTLLLHESGESIESLTEIFNKNNDAQSFGGGVSYARRYGLQSFTNVGALDDDGNIASNTKEEYHVKSNGMAPNVNFQSEEAKPWITEAQLNKVIERINTGDLDIYDKTMSAFRMKKEYKAQLDKLMA